VSPSGERSPDVRWHAGALSREERWERLGAGGVTLWFTGLPASGKSTVAVAVEERLLASGRPAYLLDGDNLRHGLNGNLGFEPGDRKENIRRTAHVARLFADAGVVALVSLVSPYREDRELARSLHADDGLPFLEVWVSTPAEECARRDPKGLYARARRGEIEGLTGVDAPYEEPEHPDLEIGGNVPVDLAAGRVLSAVGAG
jgi:adenylyl-sulfate kinase